MASFVAWVLTSLMTVVLYIAREAEVANISIWIIIIALIVSVNFLWIMCKRINCGLSHYDYESSEVNRWMIVTETAAMFAFASNQMASNESNYICMIVAMVLLAISVIDFYIMLSSFRTRIGNILGYERPVQDNHICMASMVVTFVASIGISHHRQYEDYLKYLPMIFVIINFVLFSNMFYNYFVDLRHIEQNKKRLRGYHVRRA